MTSTREIPPAEWTSFLDQFSRLHHGQDVDVRTAGAGAEEHSNARGVPLLGITAEHDEPGQAGRIHVAAGDAGGTLVTHSIDRPRRMRAREWNDAVSAELTVDATDGRTTTIRVGPARQTLPAGFITDGFYERD